MTLVSIEAAVSESAIRLEDFVPPQELFPARANYAEVARNLFNVLVEGTELQPGERVLDVGCGTGRVAVPLAGYLGEGGSYEGFDNSAARIDWCNERIAPLHPRFRFQTLDVYSSLYNPDGAVKGDAVVFPYESDEFDVVFLFSVFTHMLGEDVAHYLTEIARVLRPGGRALISWILLTDESLEAVAEQSDRRRDPSQNAHDALFSHQIGPARVSAPKAVEAVVAYEEGWALARYSDAGLTVQQPIHYGSWYGREGTLMNQDVVVARKN
jgi:ubiquinone/menaquinone biosynthesis C-methylase UbiE